MKTGDVIQCPRCSASIDDFSLCGEWFCDCGEFGFIDVDDEGEEEDAK